MINISCKFCTKSFSVKNYRANTAEYCSRSCHASATIAGKNKHNNLLQCKRCAKSYSVPNSQLKRSKYCSRLCQNRQQAEDTKISGRFNGANNPRYKGGIQLYRKIAKDNFPWICNRCNSTKNIMVHHKDENRYNNVIENLEVICRSCHQIEHKAYLNLGSYAQPKQVSEI